MNFVTTHNIALFQITLSPPYEPHSLFSHLTTFYFKGLKYEKEFVKFILKEARVLETLTIDTYFLKLRERVFEELSKFPRRSSTCLLEVE